MSASRDEMIEQAERAMLARDYETAVRMYEGAVNAFPTDPDLRLRLAGVYTRCFFDAGVEPAPYIMFRQKTDIRLATLRFDEHGFRPCIKQGETICVEAFRGTTLRRNVIVGNSTSAGSGVSAETNVVHNILNSWRAEDLWLNASMMGHNLFQNAVLLELMDLPSLENLVICGGAVDILFATAWEKLTAGYPPYWGEHRYVDGRFHSAQADSTAERRWSEAEIGHFFDIALGKLGRLARSLGARCLFVFQPHLVLCAKPRSPEEALVLSRWNASTGVPGALAELKGAYRSAQLQLDAWQRFIGECLPVLCRKHGIEWCDANAADHFITAEFLFPDPIHLVDTGHQALAALIDDRLARGRLLP